MSKTKGVKTASGDVIRLKTSFEVQDKLEAFYTGGDVQFSGDNEYMFCACGSSVKVMSVETGRPEQSFEEEEDVVTRFVVSADSKMLVVGWRSLLLKQYDWRSGTCSRSWKGHLGPVVSMAFDPTSTLLATGSSDSTVKVWDCIQHYCTHNLRGSPGIVTFLQFHSNQPLLFSSSVDCKIRVWALQTSRCVCVLEGHVSAVTALDFAQDGTVISAGRDKVIHMWDLPTGKTTRTLPVFEAVEGMVVLPQEVIRKIGKPRKGSKVKVGGTVIATAGDKGVIRLWDLSTGQILHSLPPLVGTEEEGERGGEREEIAQAYTSLLLCASMGALAGVSYDHNILLYSMSTWERTKQFVGYCDEILDLQFLGEEEQMVAMATNSEQVKVFHRESHDCHMLTGHRGIVLGLATSADRQMLASCSKDNSIRLWTLGGDGRFQCVAMGTGHTHAVGAVALSRVKAGFAVSGSMDQTIKMWSLGSVKKWKEGDPVVRLPVKFTQHAHDKDINSLDISPNDKFIVSGSQDKTAKLWQVADGALLGVFRGHRRGVWSVKFSPVDQCILTTSGDSTLKLWAVSDFSCVRTFEGHSSSVLCAVFLTRGMQIASSSGDGLIKLWTVSTTECVATLDQHSEKVWSLTTSSDGSLLLSGGADSLVCVWKDATEEVETKEQEVKEELILREQELSNLLQHGDYVKAVGLAITLDQPFRVLNILTQLLDEGGKEGQFLDTIRALREDQISAVLKYLTRWNMNAKHSRIAQSALTAVLQLCSPEQLLTLPGLKETLEGLIPYTERHFQRLSRLKQLATFVDYTWQCMKLPDQDDIDTVALRVQQSEGRRRRRRKAGIVSALADSTTTEAAMFIEDRLGDSGLGCHSDREEQVTSTCKEHITNMEEKEEEEGEEEEGKGERGKREEGGKRVTLRRRKLLRVRAKLRSQGKLVRTSPAKVKKAGRHKKRTL